ncbi:TPA: hypothetical protein HA235_07735 [Candidatus Woesearchaeota archaeon]|nr:YdeI/OmpD-associated family protein [Candidatus Woesearchaeota archaeon]HIH32570.1 hypothetical protein [Candidatus Woesearchaeota archaeon]HIH54805.1 hypothetical protein [Candidatus Woesearchaeota archaeon]HIJ02151.1 hypothetical protein [Candidatus Woesearchaeota archaeon]HIJ13643.1 hypothetical protein [Candidatus Woesearchaeota archaeon]
MTEKSFTPKNLSEWRKWLEKNHLKESKVIMIKYKKHTGRPIIHAADAMKEAICFGWIDTTAKRLDDERYSQVYVKRNQNSRWSVNTLKYGKELLKKGRMSEFGIRVYKEGLRKKAFDGHIPKNPDMPDILKKELEKSEILKEYLKNCSPSLRRMHYGQILYAKREETKIKRIMQAIEMCKEVINKNKKKLMEKLE